MNRTEMRMAVARENKTYKALAAAIKVSEQALYNKMRGESEFKESEIKTLARELNLSMEEVNLIFFDNEVN